MRQVALEPEAGAGVGKMAALDPSLPDRARPQSFVEPGERVLGLRQVSLLIPHFNRAGCH